MDSTLACLAAWMPQQRWYAAKGRTPVLRLVADLDLEGDERGGDASDHGARVRTLIVADEASTPAVVYQIPVVERPAPAPRALEAHTIGTVAGGTVLIDGIHDPAYAGALLRLTTRGGVLRSHGVAATGMTALDETAASAIAPTARASVLAGEQSNSSLVYADEGTPIICKVYRQLQPGLNPDIELETALAAAGSHRVPRPIGWVQASWVDDGAGVDASLAFAQEFLPGVEDAWRVALRAAAAGDDFAARARDLGTATAEVHVTLAHELPEQVAGTAEREAIYGAWSRRLDIAIAEVPELAPRREAIEKIYAEGRDAAFPPLQRIHGDFHLGQVVLVPDRGWVLLDFEGEPMRPMTERMLPDLALRDVAGMLRSFDYVAGSVALERPDSAHEAAAWAAAAREGYLEGYAAASGLDRAACAPLLHALELDKAVYEAIYEARNRPTWIDIPLRAVDRLSGVARPYMA
jgi:predicted trehalose synthase